MNDSSLDTSTTEEKPPSVPPVVTSAAANATTPASEQATSMLLSQSATRDDLNGSWILDKGRGTWSMRGYLETLNVPELAIQANEKGESELDTVHKIELKDDSVKITKRSRVNNNVVVELTLGKELVEYLKPDDRPKKQLATTEDPGKHLKIVSSLLTVNGMAHVTDTKRLVQEENGSILVQDLTIRNPDSNKTHTTTRCFNPHDEPLSSGKTGELGAAMATAETTSDGKTNDDEAVKMDTD